MYREGKKPPETLERVFEYSENLFLIPIRLTKPFTSIEQSILIYINNLKKLEKKCYVEVVNHIRLLIGVLDTYGYTLKPDM